MYTEVHRRESAVPEQKTMPGIVGMGAAVERAMRTMETRTAKERKLRDYLIERIETEIPYCRLNGDRTNRLPNNVNFSFRFIEGESLLIMLDMKGNLCIQWFCLQHQGLWIRPCTAGDRTAARNRTWFSAH